MPFLSLSSSVSRCRDRDAQGGIVRGVVSRVVVEDVSYLSPFAHPTFAEIGLARFIIWLSVLTASATSTGCASSWRARNRSPTIDL